MKNRNYKLILKLFFSMLYISAFTFGGGLVIVTLMKKKFVDEYSWIDEKEMLDIASLSQSSPGAIAVNAAILVGYKLCGVWGMIFSVLGTIIPPLVIISVISLFYNLFANNTYVALLLKGMQAGVAAIILDIVCSLSKDYFKTKDVFKIILIIASFVAVFFFNINVIYVIAAAAFLGIITLIIKTVREKHKHDIS